LILAFSSVFQPASAQLCDSLYLNIKTIEPEQTGRLALEIDNMTFFKNNEFNSTVQKGYTLPGFWLQVKGTYQPLSNLRFEMGAHSIWFWGTTRYPAFAYKDVSTWQGQDYSNNVHVLPYFRANLALSDNFNIVLGDLFGGANHCLSEPLYNPELNLTSDPETGVQLLYNNNWLNIDAWVNWITYIYKLDTHEEAFVTGLSSRFLLNCPSSRFHIFMPVQLLTQHRGGEINAVKSGVTTVLNGAVGAVLRWNINNGALKFMDFETDYAVYKAVKGSFSDLRKGSGLYSKLSLQLNSFNLWTSYWQCNDFVTMFGSPFFGAVSTKEAGMLYDRPQMLYLGGEYLRTLGKGFAVGVKASAYCYIAGTMYSSASGEVQPRPFGNNSNFSAGVCLRLNPSFLIKNF